MDLAIRRAGVADVAQLLALYKLLDTEPKPDLPIEQAQARFLDLAANPGHQIHVVEVELRIVATFALIFIGGLPHGARDSCIVEDVVVAQDQQGCGIGTRMMRFAMQQCAMRDCYKLALSSHVNRSSAHAFYERLGFRKHGYSYLIDRFDDVGDAV